MPRLLAVLLLLTFTACDDYEALRQKALDAGPDAGTDAGR